MVAVLFVCLGNICRSPAGEAILRHMTEKHPRHKDIIVKSCGTGDWHLGHSPDERMREAALQRGVILDNKAKLFELEFFKHFDYILAADFEVLAHLLRIAPSAEDQQKVHLMTKFSSKYQGKEVPDPYYMGGPAFDLVLDILEDSCEGLLIDIEKNS